MLRNLVNTKIWARMLDFYIFAIWGQHTLHLGKDFTEYSIGQVHICLHEFDLLNLT